MCTFLCVYQYDTRMLLHVKDSMERFDAETASNNGKPYI